MERFFNEANLTEKERQFFSTLADNPLFPEWSALFAGFPFIDNEDERIIIRGLLVFSGGVIAYFRDSQDTDSYKRYIVKQLLSNDEIADKINYDFDKYLFFKKIGDEIDPSAFGELFNEKDVRIIISVFQKINKLTKRDKRIITKKDSLGAIIWERSQVEANLDREQFQFIYDERNENTNLRVRGLAGCGKTILLAEKMACLHYHDREKRIAFVFYTKSLKQSIDRFFARFYSELQNDGREPDKERALIMHGWGSVEYPGFYSMVCSWIGVPNTPYMECADFDKLCSNLIKEITDQGKEEQVKRFDYILIDEAQDFPLNFFKLARMCLAPTGKMIYAYDELQVLNSSSKRIPSKSEIFGSEPCKDINLSKCYRTPKEILVAAHALGLGIYHLNNDGKREIINAISDASIWHSIGYKVESGKLRGGETVVLSREFAVPNKLGGDSIIGKEFASLESQADFAIHEIARLISEEEVSPDDFLIIDLDSRNINYNHSFFHKRLIDAFPFTNGNERLPFETKVINKDAGYSFRTKDKVPYTTIFRAKGNEANIVFVMNSNNSDTILSYSRNRLFTAMTRAKFKVYICGIAGPFMDAVAKEIQWVRKNNYKLDFVYPTQEEISNCKRKVYEDNQTSEKVNNALDILSGAGGSGITSVLLETLLGRLSENERKEFLEKIVLSQAGKPKQ